MSHAQPPLSYDVLLHARVTTRIGPAARWFIAGSHASRPQARLQYLELCQEFPDPQVILLLVMVAHDAESGRFRDRIIDARGLAPLIDRRGMEALTPAQKQRIAAACAWRPEAPKPASPPPTGGGLAWWLAGGGAALAVAALALLR